MSIRYTTRSSPFGSLMEPALESGWCDEEEAAKNSDADDSSVDEETEAILYSLVHHKPPSDEELDHSAVNGGSDVGEPHSFSIRRQAVLNMDSNLDGPVVVISDTEVNNGKRKKQRKDKKKKRRTLSPNAAEERMISSSIPQVSDCNSWTPDMARFYNQHWGNRNLDEIRSKMPGHSRHWKILEVDRYGPRKRTGPHARTRCRNCHQLGHPLNRCPDPPKQIVCHMCGQIGHREPRCPNKICLRTSPYEISNYSNLTTYKPSKKLYCCVCASRGHSAHECLGSRSLPPCGSVIPGPSTVKKMAMNGDIMGLEAILSKKDRINRKRERMKQRLQRAQRKLSNMSNKGMKGGRYRESYINYSKIS